MNNLRMVLGAILLVFSISFFWAGSQANLINSLKEMIRDPWGAVTLLDLYTGLIVVATWIFCVERRAWVAALWTLALFGLGNFATVLYLFVRTYRVATVREMFFPK